MKTRAIRTLVNDSFRVTKMELYFNILAKEGEKKDGWIKTDRDYLFALTILLEKLEKEYMKRYRMFTMKMIRRCENGESKKIKSKSDISRSTNKESRKQVLQAKQELQRRDSSISRKSKSRKEI